MKNLRKKKKKKQLEVKRKAVICLFFVVMTGALIYSCQNRPKEVLNRKSMERLMQDVYVAEATMENDYQNFDTPEKKKPISIEFSKRIKSHKPNGTHRCRGIRTELTFT